MGRRLALTISFAGVWARDGALNSTAPRSYTPSSTLFVNQGIRISPHSPPDGDQATSPLSKPSTPYTVTAGVHAPTSNYPRPTGGGP